MIPARSDRRKPYDQGADCQRIARISCAAERGTASADRQRVTVRRETANTLAAMSSDSEYSDMKAEKPPAATSTANPKKAPPESSIGAGLNGAEKQETKP